MWIRLGGNYHVDKLSDRIAVVLAGLDDLRPDARLIAREVLAIGVEFAAADEAPKEAVPIETDDGRAAWAWLERVPSSEAVRAE